ncbi:hypothetical protein E0Z10_g5537 [Xylaria hypoxylon]|uniref:Uncharacterized protein n=1 Tax=Xylaria hypoxylon TaxID=37992 RepID=A0A4Z0Z3L3_9PEZI|nr:hypothetical protein E0Z10_g5537 [Xylaria hypoxylon]
MSVISPRKAKSFFCVASSRGCRVKPEAYRITSRSSWWLRRAGNRRALYGIACLFRDQEDRPRRLIISVPGIRVRFTGGNIVGGVIQVLQDYQIEDEVGYFALGNAGNNDTAMDEIGNTLNFPGPGAERRGRCFGHVLNLSARALLYGADFEAFEQDIANTLTIAEHRLWQ